MSMPQRHKVGRRGIVLILNMRIIWRWLHSSSGS